MAGVRLRVTLAEAESPEQDCENFGCDFGGVAVGPVVGEFGEAAGGHDPGLHFHAHLFGGARDAVGEVEWLVFIHGVSVAGVVVPGSDVGARHVALCCGAGYVVGAGRLTWVPLTYSCTECPVGDSVTSTRCFPAWMMTIS